MVSVDRLSVANLNLYRRPLPYIPPPTVLPPPPLTDAAKTAVTGTEVDDKFAAQIIGKDIPVFVGGGTEDNPVRMGCRIAEGPFITTVDDAGLVDLVVTPCVVATPSATRYFTGIRLNGTLSFTSGDGGATWTPVAAGPFDDVEITVLPGSETQTPLASSIARYGARAVPYRSHIIIELKYIPLSVFANVIPFVTIEFYESECTRNEMLLKLAQYARFDTSECEFGVSGTDPFWIVAQQSTFMEYLQNLQRSIGRNWNIVASDKLKVFENSATVTPVTITRDDIVEDTIKFLKNDALSIPAIRTLGFIDTGRDNDFNSVKAVRARFPAPLTASQDSEDLEIPIGMTATAAKTAVNKSLLIDDIARDRFACRLLPSLRYLEAGDIIEVDVDDDIEFATARILSVARNAADWTIDIVAERINMALLPTGPTITSNGGGSTASITVDEEQTAVTTVTADNDDAGTFAIAGGDDAALFTIHATTGVLTFLVAPDYEDPTDADTDNVYEVIVQVGGSGLLGTQAISVTVANVSDGGGIGSPMGLLLGLTYS